MTARAKFTPGPWSVYHVHDTIEVQFGPMRKGRGRAPVVHWTGFGNSDLPISVQAANARLMAAAPDMLAALILVVSVADRSTDEFAAAHRAIAKATEAP